MACDELRSMREDARQVSARLAEKMQKAQDFALESGGPNGGRTDYEPFLRSRLAQIEVDIRGHIKRHHCE